MPKQKIIETIEEFDTIIIHRHVNPDPDALGSQCGLRDMLVATYPEKEIYVVGEEDPSFNFLVRMDEIADDVFEDALIIACDTANTGRISDERYKLGKKIIKIDHHPNIDPYGDVLWVDTDASSTSEMIYELYLEAENKWKMTDSAARLIYAGIVGDTGRFLFPSTRRKTFRYAADLIEYDFDRTALYDGLYDVDLNIARLRGYILQNLTITEAGMSAIKISKETLEKYNVTAIETGRLVGTPGDVKGVVAWVFFIEEEDQIRVRLRSKGPHIHKLAEKNKGGGHPLASGAKVYTWEEAEALRADLDAICAAYQG